MNLEKIIKESINNVLLDSIISESINKIVDQLTTVVALNERNYNRNRGGRRRQQRNRNLGDVRRQNAQSRSQQSTQNTQQTPQPETQQNTQNTQQTPQPETQQNTQNTQQTPQPETQQNTQNAQQNTQQNAQQADFSQYANQIRQYIGNTGIDTTPVNDNDLAKRHIEELNPFLFDIVKAIEDGNITKQQLATANNSNTYSTYSNSRNPYSKNGLETGMDISSGLVNFAGNTAHNIAHMTPGFDKANELFGGVVTTGLNAYNKDKQAIQNAIRQNRMNRYYNSASGYNSKGTSSSVTPLSQLLGLDGGDDRYHTLYNEYRQINQTNNGILDNVRGVPECYTILSYLSADVAKYMKQETANAQQAGNNTQNNGAQQTGNNPQNSSEHPGNNVQDDDSQSYDVDYKGFMQHINNVVGGIFDDVPQEVYNDERELSYVKENLNGLFYLCDGINNAIRYNRITEDVNNNVPLLTTLMGLDEQSNTIPYNYVLLYKQYVKINEWYDKVLKRSDKVYETYHTLSTMRDEMIDAGIGNGESLGFEIRDDNQ